MFPFYFVFSSNHEKCADYLYASPRFTTNLKSIIETSAHRARRSNSFCYMARFIFEVVIR